MIGTEVTVAKVKVLVFSAYFPPAFLGGGALKSVAAIVSQAPKGYDIDVIASNTDLGQSKPLDVPADSPERWEDATVFYASSNLRGKIKAIFYARASAPRIIYTNSFFDPGFSLLPLIMWRLRLLRTQYFVIAPRGEFGPGALNIKPMKKKLFLWAFRFLIGGRGLLWHASSRSEADNIHTLINKSAPVLIAEDNTALPVTAEAPTSPGPVVRTVIMGRIVPVKGVEDLIQALAGVSLPVVVDIYGPEEDADYARRCRARAAELPNNVSIHFRGALPGSEVTSVLKTYDVMLLPTKGENFSHVVAEALSVSLPVMCADVTPWSSYISEGGGVLLSDNEKATWAAAVERYAALDHLSRRSNRIAAGQQYDRWRASTSGQPHIFDLILDPNFPLQFMSDSAANR